MLKVLPRIKRSCTKLSVQHGQWYGHEAAYNTVDLVFYAPLTPWGVGVDPGRWYENQVRTFRASCRIAWEDEC
jgi:hypothetical protein